MTEESNLSPMLVSKEERIYIEKQRLFQYFLLNFPNIRYTKPFIPGDPPIDILEIYLQAGDNPILKKIKELCPSYKSGEIPPIDILEIYLQALIGYIELNYNKTEIAINRTLSLYYERDPIKDPNALTRYGYNIQLSYVFPSLSNISNALFPMEFIGSLTFLGYGSDIHWPNLVKEIEETKHLKLYYLKALAKPLLKAALEYFGDLNPSVLLSQGGLATSQSYTVQFSEGMFNVILNSQLNFLHQIVSSIKTIACQDLTNEEVLLAISKRGKISYLRVIPSNKGGYNKFHSLGAELIGTHVDKETIFEIIKQIQDKNDLEDENLLKKSLKEAIITRQKNEKQKESLPYDSTFFASISSKEIKKLAEEVSWNYALYKFDSNTIQSYREILTLESKAIDMFLAINHLKGFEITNEKIKREKIQFTCAGEIDRGIILSYVYSFDEPNRLNLRDVAFPVLLIPASNIVLEKYSWRSLASEIAQKSYEMLGVTNINEDIYSTFIFPTTSKKYTVFSYSFAKSAPDKKNELEYFTFHLISTILREEFLQSIAIKRYLIEEVCRIVNYLKESSGIKELQTRFTWYRESGKSLREDGNPNWEVIMVQQFFRELTAGNFRGNIYLLETTYKDVQKRGIELLNQLERLQDEDEFLNLESKAIDTFLALNHLTGSKEEGIYLDYNLFSTNKIDRIQSTYAGEIDRGIILSYVYSFGEPNVVNLRDVAFPVLLIPASNTVLDKYSWFSLASAIAQKSFETLGFVCLHEHSYTSFMFPTISKEYTVFSYTFAMQSSHKTLDKEIDYMRIYKIDNFTFHLVSSSLKEKFLQKEGITRYLIEEILKIVNYLTESLEIKRLQSKFAEYYVLGSEDRNPGSDNWEVGMVQQFVVGITVENFPSEYTGKFLDNTRENVQKKGIELLNQLERLQNEEKEI